jgi:hypothetical protein
MQNNICHFRVEEGSNTTTAALGVVEGDTKGSLRSDTVKYGRDSPWDSDPRMTALVRTSRNCIRQTRPLVRESAPQKKKNQQLSESNKNLTVSPRWLLYPKTGWSTYRRS